MYNQGGECNKLGLKLLANMDDLVIEWAVSMLALKEYWLSLVS